MTTSDTAFEAAARATLEACLDAVEEAGIFDADLEGGVLTINSPGGKTWVLNKHGPMRQLWLSSPFSGASHYDLNPEGRTWRDTRGGPPLESRFARELSDASGRKVDIDP